MEDTLMFNTTYFPLYLLLPILVLFSSVPILQAQTVTVSGTVFEAETLRPLPGANVVQQGTDHGTATNEEGRFSLTLIDGGDNYLLVSFLGYETERVEVIGEVTDLEIRLRRDVIQTGEVFVQALRADESIPISYSNISRQEIEQRNLGQDMPFLVASTPSVVATSDAGTGIGYTGVRIRGVDPTRINVTINGIPVNDAESHGVFWVNMPDLASSVDNIQIQRGVGSSTHGAGAFGGTMNIQTARMETQPYAEVNTTIGSFNTQKYNVLLSSGRVGDGWQFEGRLSKIESDGYIDRAFSDLRSFYLSGTRHGERSLLKADIFSGHEITYQAWNGVPEPILNNDAQQLEQHISGLFLGPEEADRLRDNLGNRRFNEFTYDNQVDNYQQDHYQLHYSFRPSDEWILNSSLHYTRGRGYFEQFRDDDNLSTYGIEPVEIGGETISSSDLIRRRWLDNHFYGAIVSGEWSRESWNLTVGGGYNEYDGDHFGEVIWARFAGQSEHEERYYDNNGFKTDFNVYGKINYYFTDNLNAYLDLQHRTVTYRFLGLRVDEQNDQQITELQQRVRLDFFNPKFGLVYRIGDNSRAFASFSAGSKEPTRRDYVESTPESRPDPEHLYNAESGFETVGDWYRAGVNLYYMYYVDQLILTGAVNDVGAYVRENVTESYRSGIELHGEVNLTENLHWLANATFSRNKIPEYTRWMDDFDQGGQQPVVFENTDIAFSPSVIANSILRYRIGNWSASVASNYVSQQYLDNTQSPDRSIDSYMVHDLQLGYTTGSTPWIGEIDFSLQVNNLFGREYVSNGYTFGWIAGGEEQHFNYLFPQAGRHLMMKVTARF